VDFESLYELQDDQRKGRTGPLRFTRSLVTLSPFCSDAEAHYFERMRALKIRPERYLLRSLLEDLVNWSGGKPFGQRGYLITCEGRPATCEYLAEQLGMNVGDIEQALPVLERLGFLDRVPLNGKIEQSETSRLKTGKKRGKESEHKKGRKSKNAAKRTVGGHTKGLPESAGPGRTEPETLCPPSRKNKNKNKSKSKSKSKAKEKSNRPSASKVKDEDNPRPSASAEEQSQVQTASRPEQSQTTEGTATSPATAPPMIPTLSDAGGSVIDSTGPPGSVHHVDNPGHISHALNSVRRRCNQAAVQAGRDIYRALGSPWPEDSPESAREVGAFASCFERATGSGIGPTVLVQLWEGLTREAARLRKVYAKNGNGYRSAARVWCKRILPGKLAAAAAQRPP